ncbi:hypothetical protein LEP1GSC052_3269 [Leptospira kmetyi serovar Malaysia str. Bejo-Iso9]|nr:hypothetical protein LEP1GSC052_3269 [Leptospira kmetyi serovar Malaysia str. Bejo-Iso9]
MDLIFEKCAFCGIGFPFYFTKRYDRCYHPRIHNPFGLMKTKAVLFFKLI